jgi:hypothetical protein
LVSCGYRVRLWEFIKLYAPETPETEIEVLYGADRKQAVQTVLGLR